MSDEEKQLRVELEIKENELRRLRAQLSEAGKVNADWMLATGRASPEEFERESQG